MSYKFSAPALPSTDMGISHINQDSGFTEDNALGVFDGHGFKGELHARTCAETFKIGHSSGELDFETLFESAEEACRNKLRETLKSSGIQFIENDGVFFKAGLYERITPFQGGTTATIVTLNPDTGVLSCANVGDSDAMFFDSSDKDGEVITADHTPNCLEEWKRISSKYPTVKCVFSANGSNLTARPVWNQFDFGLWELNELGGYQYVDVRSNWASYINVPVVGTLAMTRVMANFGFKKFGIIAKPDVCSVDAPVSGVTRAVVLGSDGLWDAVHYNEVRDIVRSPELLGKPEEATTALLKFGIDKSKERFTSPACHDNITVIVAYYDGI